MRVLMLTALAMFAFAGNSLLCRLALRNTGIDAASFTSVRLLSGACVLMLLMRLSRGNQRAGGDWAASLALFIYAAGFSYAYRTLPAGTGAILLFGAVQLTMIGYGLCRGERFGKMQVLGFVAACAGLVALLLPGAGAPSIEGAALMLAAGIAWGIYSLRGRGAADALGSTAGNFVRASAITLLLSAVTFAHATVDLGGVAYAVAGGALTSGLGYAIWYTALRGLSATQAATVQLTVPVLAAAGAVLVLGEAVTWRLAVTSAIVLGGVALVIANQPSRRFRS
jgi:drug/metabolite transporter (DMT)-like permease